LNLKEIFRHFLFSHVPELGFTPTRITKSEIKQKINKTIKNKELNTYLNILLTLKIITCV